MLRGQSCSVIMDIPFNQGKKVGFIRKTIFTQWESSGKVHKKNRGGGGGGGNLFLKFDE